MIGRLTVAFDYAHVALYHPRLFGLAARNVLRIKARLLRGFIFHNRRRSFAPLIEMSQSLQSRSALLSLLSETIGILVIRDLEHDLAIGVRDIDFCSAVSTLKSFCPAGRLVASDTKIDLTAASWQTLSAASQVTFIVPGGCEIKVEQYQRRGSEFWLSQNRRNQDARALYSNILHQKGLHQLSEVIPAPTLERRRHGEPIDVVYTWVNHRDQDWLAAFSRYCAPHSAQGGGDERALSRFHSSDELRYSLRSVARNLPWVRRIHVLTNCKPPDWLDITHDRIHWISHESVIPSAYLPTFSSHVIESYLHLIPGLSKRFIYMNDDFFITSKKDKLFFFGESGNSRVFLEDDGVVSGQTQPSDPDYLNASRNSAQLLLREFGIWPTRLHKHVAYALDRDILAEIESKWPEEFSRFRSSKFRSINDLNLTSFLYHHYALATARAEVASIRMSLIMSMDLRWRNRFRNALDGDVDALCINEGGADRPARSWHPSLSRFLQDHFDTIAPWEQ